MARRNDCSAQSSARPLVIVARALAGCFAGPTVTQEASGMHQTHSQFLRPCTLRRPSQAVAGSWPNKRFEPTAQKLRFWVPSALRAPAAAQAQR